MGRVQLPNYPVPGEALSVAQLQKKASQPGASAGGARCSLAGWAAG